MHEANGIEAAIRFAVQRLGVRATAEVDDIRVLAGGMSGSSVTAFVLNGVRVVLKRTVPGGPDASLRERATREVRFYCELAGVVPVQVPTLLGADLDPAGGTLLLLAACEPVPPPDAWTDVAYAEVARDLARFHAAMRKVPLPSWVPVPSTPTLGQYRGAAESWQAFAAATGLIPDGLLRRMEATIARVTELDAAIPAGPATLCHGDFHAGNLLRDRSGAWVWADWQDLRIGPGVDDLAFFWERAFAASGDADPPFDLMFEAYWTGLAEAGDPGMSRAAYGRALAWSELRGWLIAWPPYLVYLTPARQERVVARIEALLREGVGRRSGSMAGHDCRHDDEQDHAFERVQDDGEPDRAIATGGPAERQAGQEDARQIPEQVDVVGAEEGIVREPVPAPEGTLHLRQQDAPEEEFLPQHVVECAGDEGDDEQPPIADEAVVCQFLNVGPVRRVDTDQAAEGIEEG